MARSTVVRPIAASVELANRSSSLGGTRTFTTTPVLLIVAMPLMPRKGPTSRRHLHSSYKKGTFSEKKVREILVVRSEGESLIERL